VPKEECQETARAKRSMPKTFGTQLLQKAALCVLLCVALVAA